ncbi:DNA internalization-related competence protein ComEC/Rec2 [Companilactobacillus sp. HBUAS56257]|uniref:DNA internalization-related competence protein ComEC/Rec2 n=1 Tax=Companilactobacillus sp. HBUAS56257 TaxID=3109360 RepID=UPI002FEEAFB0
MKNWSMVIWIVLLTTVFSFRLQTFQVPNKPNVNQAVIFSDQISINGDSLSGQMHLENQVVRFNYRLKSQSEQKNWQTLSGMYTVKPNIEEVKTIDSPRNPAEFNFGKYLANKGIFYRVRVKEFNSIEKITAVKIFDKINVLRTQIIKNLNQLPKWLRIHAQSLIVGYTQSSDKDFLKILSSLGIIHLFSLSGLHVLIILTIVVKITSLLKIPREWVETAMLTVLPCYGLLVGSKSGIWRAIVLVMVGIIVKKASIAISRLDLFSITMLICLFIYPFAIVEMGGQLSFLLAFAILYLYQGANFFEATLKMNLVSLPIICYYTYQINWLTLLVNLIFIPIFSYLILPITLLSALTVHWSFWRFVNEIFEKMYSLLDYFASDPNFMFVTGQISSWFVIILLIISLFLVESKTIFNKYLFQYVILLLVCVGLNKFPVFGCVNIIDVGQGDSILLTTPFLRKVYLIDTGGKVKFNSKPWTQHESLNQVDTSTIPYLKSKGIDRVDRLFLSHKDQDHIGNLETLLAKFPVSEVNFGFGLEQNKRIKALITKYPQIKFVGRKQGDVINDAINFQVLWPKNKGLGENKDSLTLLTKIKDKSWLFTGDLDIASEKKILKDYHFKVDYLKLGHHGSKTSTSDELLTATKPKIGFISAGVNNRYGHPNKETLERLEKHQVKYLNTAEYGMISWYYNFFDDKEEITTFLKGDLFEDN